MGNQKKKNGMFFFVLAMTLLFTTVAQAEIKIGVLAKRGPEKAMSQWGPTGAYLSAKLGEPVTIIPLKFTAIEPLVKSGGIDFMLANSAFYVEMEKKYGAHSVATLINSRNGKALDTFGGVILVRKDSPIQTLADIKGKKFMCVKFSSFGGAHMAQRLFLDNGIDAKKDFAAFVEGSKHDNVVLAVQNGSMDAGTVRTDTLERMEGEGKISMADFRIINEQKDDFPFVRSTRLYPEWPMAALKHFDAAKAKAVGAALKAMSSSDEAAKSAKIVGWKDSADYTSVRDCLKAIKFGAFAD
ncbi:MAG: phosphate/phosphite/phosphonate ABC transporter substrate-binding protein [Desulfobulbaceae bacterium]|nr:phosphate/phosphite/phosphonate ABC transporter substrate-binding protein [Desulfobulbaceae bacterium]HIJ79572.1 phosphate/phosphite/phosphonate ABC transporter substrate-binding protein [Deltaproteobacteria bacterium]